MNRELKNLKIDAELHNRLRILAAKRGMFLSRLVEDIIEIGLQSVEGHAEREERKDRAEQGTVQKQ